MRPGSSRSGCRWFGNAGPTVNLITANASTGAVPSPVAPCDFMRRAGNSGLMNAWCEALGIAVPSLAVAGVKREATTFGRLVVALLERGAPMTLEEVAAAFEEAELDDAASALASLKRCRPGRTPVYRDGDRYALDAHDAEAGYLVFRLGLRPPMVPPLRLVREEPAPLPGPEQPLTTGELEEAFRDAYVWSWSALRLALAVLDAHGGRLPGTRAVDLLNELTHRHVLRVDSAAHWRSGAIVADESGVWTQDRADPALRGARSAVRQRVAVERRRKALAPDPAVVAAYQRRHEAKRATRAAELAALKRVLVRASPAAAPAGVTLLDPATRELTTLLGGDVASAGSLLEDYDFIAAENVRPLLRTLGFDPGLRRVAELGPPQKSIRLNRQGRTLRITLPLLIRGSCGISRPFGDPATIAHYVASGQAAKARRRLEADAKSLFAYYQYGRLHGAVRLRWGFLDEMFGVPWSDRAEPTLHDLEKRAHETGRELEIVTGNAPGWQNPWAQARRCTVVPAEWGFRLTDDDGWPIDDRDVKLARIV